MKTKLNGHYYLYRRKLLQGALMQRSCLQNSFFGRFVFEYAELAEEL